MMKPGVLHGSLAGWALALTLAFVLAACAPTPPSDLPEPSPAVFAIEGSDGAPEGWLMGTIHALPDGVNWRTEALGKVLGEADYLIVEVADPSSKDTARVFADLARTPGLGPLAERVAPSLRGDVLALMERAGAQPGDFRATETWAAALTLAQASSSGSRSNSVDVAIIADFSDRRVIELEGAAAQLAIFDALATDDQRALLEGVINEANEAEEKASDLDRAWLSGDLAAIETATKTGFLTDPDLRAALLTDRNRAWATRLIKALEEPERPLIAVGAAHVPGPQGLIALLEERGFTLRRIQ